MSLIVDNALGQRGRNNVARQFVILAVCWSLFICITIVFSSIYYSRHSLKLAVLQAKTAFAKDVIYRRWNATRGGVYVPISQATPPNLFLKVPNREISSASVGELTLVNPAYMTRQVHELELEETGVRGHITSLNPIRPLNKPDSWEKSALQAFETGVQEKYSVETLGNEPYLRFMQPLSTETGCLKCHAEQGYKTGDIRGGISVSVPMGPLHDLQRPVFWSSTSILLSIWLAGIMGIFLSHRKIVHQMDRELQTHREKEEMAARLLQVQKMEAIGQLAAGIAHEMNTPLQYIRTNIKFLRESFEEVIDSFFKLPGFQAPEDHVQITLQDDIKKFLTDIDWDYLKEEIPLALQQSDHGLGHVGGIIQALKEFATPGTGIKVATDLNNLIENVVTISQHEWKSVATIQLELLPGLPLIPLIANEIRQVFLNLIVNAAQAIEEKEIEKKRKGGIIITTERKAEKLVARVQDTGAGISKEVIERIFDPFYSTKDVGVGSGQGLYICYDIITNKHDGEISVESEEGVGAIFTLTFPLTSS